MLMAVLGVVSLPIPSYGTITNNKDGSFVLSELLISEVAAGYAAVSAANCRSVSGDFIEIYANQDVSLDDYTLHAMSSTGTTRNLNLPAGLELSKGSVLLLGCVAGSDSYSDINLTDSRNDGGVWLMKNAVEVDRVSYLPMGIGKSFERDICANKFVLSAQMSPGVFDANIECDPVADPPEQYCQYLVVSEIEANEKWVEIYNSASFYLEPENLAGCVMAIQEGNTVVDANGQEVRKYNKNTYDFAGHGEIAPLEYFIIDVVSPMSLPSSSSIKNRAVVVQDSTQVYSMLIYGSHKSGTSWVAEGLTYNVTKATQNEPFQPYPFCDAALGLELNALKNGCRKLPDPPAECAEGQYRNPATGRCKKFDSDKALAECAEGQYRNPLTNRCKKFSTGDDLVPCAEGWERNPETNRCRKIRNSDDAAYAIDPLGVSSQNNTWMIIGAAGLGIIGLLIGLQFRHEIARGFGKVWGKIKK